MTKRGHIVVGYWFSPPDADSRTDEDADRLSDDINEACRMFGTGWASWSDVISIPAGRYPAPEESYFPDPFSRAVDDVRRQQFEAKGACFENERAFLVSYAPPPSAVSKLSDLFFTDTRKNRRPMAAVLDHMEKQLTSFENRIGAQLGLRRMTSFPVEDNFGVHGRQDELVNYLYYCATGRTHGIMLPKDGPAYFDTLIATQDLTPAETPIIGSDYVAVVTIEKIPDESQPNIIAGLNTLPFPYRFTQRMIYLDPVHAVKDLTKYQTKWKQKQKSFAEMVVQSGNTPLNEHAVQMTNESNQAIAWAERSEVKWGFYSAAIVIRGQDPAQLKEWADMTAEVIGSCAFASRIEETNTTEAWRGGLPGEVQCNVRRPPVHTKTMADLMPASGVWTGEEQAPCPLYPQPSPALLWAITDGAIPFRLNLHIGKNGQIGHTAIFGPSEAGKSTLSNIIAVQARRYQNMQITCFDNKYGMAVTAWACGGEHHDVINDIDGDGLYCPLANLETEEDVDWAIDYLFLLYEFIAKHEPSGELRTKITSAVADRLRHVPPTRRSMTDFVQALQDLDAKEVFKHYTHAGSAGRFLDGRMNSTSRSRFRVYEMQQLMALGDTTALPVLLHQFREFERTLKGDPTLLFIAEAWQAFKHPLWATRLEDWLRRMRSKNCSVIMDTQSLSEAAQSKMLPLLAENAQRKIYLPNAAAFNSTDQKENPGSYELYKIFGLNDNQIGMIASMTPKREYLATGPDGCRRFNLGLSQFELAVVGATSEQEVNAIRSLRNTHGDRWLSILMRQKGCQYDHSCPIDREAAYA